MSALAQVLHNLQAVPPTLDAVMPAVASTSRELARQAITKLAETGGRAIASPVAHSGAAVGADLGADALVAKIDPTLGIRANTFSVESPLQAFEGTRAELHGNMTNLVQVAEAKDREDRRRREPAFAPIAPVSSGPSSSIIPWERSLQPMMRASSGASRQPLMKF